MTRIPVIGNSLPLTYPRFAWYIRSCIFTKVVVRMQCVDDPSINSSRGSNPVATSRRHPTTSRK